MTERELLLRVTRNDFKETHTRGSGPGGQHRNKTATGVRLEHRASGAVAESTQFKSQEQNRIAAWKLIRETPKWRAWFRTALAEAMGHPSLESRLEDQLQAKHIRTQIQDENERWVDVPLEALDRG